MLDNVEIGKQARALARQIAIASPLWDFEDQTLKPPEANLMMAVIQQAIIEATWMDSVNEKRRMKAIDAYRFFDDERLELFADMIELEADWIKKRVYRWLTVLFKQQGIL